MGYDAMANDASAPASVPGGRKKVNRSAKLKQRKLDARREQWLSQVKDKDPKIKIMAGSPTSPLPPYHLSLSRNSEMRQIEVEREEMGLHGSSDSDSPTRTPNSSSSGHPTRKGCGGCPTESSSGTVSDVELEEGDEGKGEAVDRDGDHTPLDDWEAVADALSTDNDRGDQNLDSEAAVVKTGSSEGVPTGVLLESDSTLRPPRAWRADDATRPPCLPSLSKQTSFASELEQRNGSTHPIDIPFSMSSCPICCEDLDITDSSFLPCSCGFRLCLFCHKRILEEDGRCPGCRKLYDPMVVGDAGFGAGVLFSLPRSCSIFSRS